VSYLDCIAVEASIGRSYLAPALGSDVGGQIRRSAADVALAKSANPLLHIRGCNLGAHDRGTNPVKAETSIKPHFKPDASKVANSIIRLGRSGGSR
jgi:hypothetical protein